MHLIDSAVDSYVLTAVIVRRTNAVADDPASPGDCGATAVRVRVRVRARVRVRIRVRVRVSSASPGDCGATAVKYGWEVPCVRFGQFEPLRAWLGSYLRIKRVV